MNLAEDSKGAQTLQNASTLKSEEYRERVTLLGLSLPAVLAILIVVFLPIFWLSSLSFYNAAGALSLENYARIFESALYRRTFVVTFQISIAVTVICVFLGYPLCYWLSKLPDRTAAMLMVFVLVPFWTSVLVRTYAWLVLLQRNGVINSSLMSLGVIEEPLQLAHNLTGSIIGMVHIMLPFLILPLYATMRSIDTDLVRAAVGLGSSPRGAFWRVFFPMSLPGLLPASCWSSSCRSAFTSPLLCLAVVGYKCWHSGSKAPSPSIPIGELHQPWALSCYYWH